jgi:hypothetical protein
MAASDMLIEIYMAESTILRTEKISKKKMKIQEQIAMAKLYLYQAVDIVTLKGKRKCYFFVEDEQRMMLMGLRRFNEIYKYAIMCRFKRNNYF